MGDYLTYPTRDGRRPIDIKPVDDSNLVDSLIQWEGFIPHPKDIGDGKITLGSGLTDPKWHELYRKRGNVWSEEDNKRAVAEEVADRRKTLEGLVPYWNEIPSETQKAFIAYHFNYPFNRTNSPNMFKAFDRKDLQEAINQMDATSSNPAFVNGLELRREKERSWARSGLGEPQNQKRRTFADRIVDRVRESATHPGRYGRWETAPKTTTPLNTQGWIGDLLEKSKPLHGKGAGGRWAEGGQMNKSAWDSLSMREKAEMMKVAVRNGITNLEDIRQKYNEFAEGGGLSDEGYVSQMEKVAEQNYRQWGYSNPDEALVHALNDNTYDYRGFYNKYPQSDANADTHWTDEFKTVWHPTLV